MEWLDTHPLPTIENSEQGEFENQLLEIPWIAELNDRLMEYSMKVWEFRHPPQQPTARAWCCQIALQAAAREGRDDPLTKYLLSREVEGCIEELKVAIPQHRGKKQRLVDAILSDPSLLNTKRAVLELDYGCKEKTVKDAVKIAKEILSRTGRMPA